MNGFNTLLSELLLIATGILKGKMFNTPHIVSIVTYDDNNNNLFTHGVVLLQVAVHYS